MVDITTAALRQAGDAIIVIDTAGTIREWNAMATTLFGYTADQMLGQSLDAIIPEKLRQAHDRGFATAMTQGHLTSDGKPRRTKAIRSDGAAVYVVMTFAVITDDDDTALGSVAVAREWERT